MPTGCVAVVVVVNNQVGAGGGGATAGWSNHSQSTPPYMEGSSPFYLQNLFSRRALGHVTRLVSLLCFHFLLLAAAATAASCWSVNRRQSKAPFFMICGSDLTGEVALGFSRLLLFGTRIGRRD